MSHQTKQQQQSIKEKNNQPKLNIHQVKAEVPEPEVVPQAKRRQFSAAYKLQIVEEADRCQAGGEVGALLRREGLYSSNLSRWRQLREQGQLQALGASKRGRQAPPRLQN